MLCRPPVSRILGAFLLAWVGFAGVASATPPKLVSAVSRMTQGIAGTFDVPLPLTGGSGIECRDVSRGMTLVLKFDQPIAKATPRITSGVATLGIPKIVTNSVTIKLTNVRDAQSLVLNVSNVRNAAGETLASVDVPFRVLKGDVDASGSVTAQDLILVKGAVLKKATVRGDNFRGDVTADGRLTIDDITVVQAAQTQGSTVVGKDTTNTPPTISTIPNQQAVTGQPSTPAGFTVGDAESDPSTLFVSASSSDTATIPNANIALAGTGASRTVTITPASGITTVIPVTITVNVSDGLASTQTSFTVTVTPPPTTYLATLQPMSGVTSLGYGSATLTLSGDKTYAIIRYSYSNLAGADTDDAIYAPGDAVLYDIPVGKARGDLQPDGSLRWQFNVNNAANIVSTIQANDAYIILESSAYPAGELKGTFVKVVGSQTFTPPPPPPPLTINPPSKYDASRFLQQAAFGGTGDEIAMLSNGSAFNASTALNDWLAQQFATPGPIWPNYQASAITPPLGALGAQSVTQPYTPSSMYYQMYLRTTQPQFPNAYADTLSNDRIHEVWWKNVVTAPDQLRQRVATALSELFVVSENEGTVNGNLMGLASYYDMLADDAFVNFRQLLGDVTLHPIMGQYLNMRGNKKATPPASPNENYAREVMQLFDIGLYMLQPDGTLVLDQNGQPIPTYDQTTITNFAQVFTGWDVDPTPVKIPTLVAPVAPATQPTVTIVSSSYQKPMVVTASNHSTLQKNLLNYPGAATYPGASSPAMIPATTIQTTASATEELNFALDNIFRHPNVGPFISKQLIQRLVTSNPSPAYVYRVAKVFNDDGTPQHVRGNMKAVIYAILTDYEARNVALTSDPGYGHLREPMIRIANLLRSCGGFSKTGKWAIGKTDATLSQTVFRSPTVFNFFDPKYQDPGVIQQAGIVSPENQIVYATTVTASQNMIYTGIYGSNYGTPPTGTGFKGDAFGSDVYLDFSLSGNSLVSYCQANGVSATIDQVALLLVGAPLDPNAKTIIQNFITTKIEATSYLEQVKAAVHLIATSPQAAVQR